MDFWLNKNVFQEKEHVELIMLEMGTMARQCPTYNDNNFTTRLLTKVTRLIKKLSKCVYIYITKLTKDI